MKEEGITRRTVAAVERMDLNHPFGIEELYEDNREANCVSVVLNKLRKAGRVVKLGRGVFCRPRRVDGTLVPVRKEDIVSYVERKYDGYATSEGETVTIASPKPQKRLELGGYGFVFRKSIYGFNEAQKHRELLLLLDTITESEDDDSAYTDEVSALSDVGRKDMVELSMSYPLRTRMRLYSLLKAYPEHIRTLSGSLRRRPKEDLGDEPQNLQSECISNMPLTYI